MAQTYSPDVRIVLWTGRKFLFFGREDFRDLTWRGEIPMEHFRVGEKDFLWNLPDEMGLVDKSGDNPLTEFINILPETVTIDQGSVRENTCSIEFSMPDSRYYFRPETQPGEMALADLLKNYGGMCHMEFLRDRIQKKGYYEAMWGKLFDKKVWKEDKGMEKYFEPELLFQPHQIIWVEYLGRDHKWYSGFTGIILSIKENLMMGKKQSIGIQAASSISLLRNIPAVEDYITGTLTDHQFDSDLLPFYKVWLASTFVPYTKLSNNISLKAIAALPLPLVFSLFGRVANRRMGAVSKDELLADFDDGLLDSTAVGLSPVKEDDINFYCDMIETTGFIRPKIFSEDVEEYKGFSLERPVAIHMNDLLFKRTHKRYSADGSFTETRGRAANILKYRCVGLNYLGSIFVDKENYTTPDLLEKVIKVNINMFKMDIGTIADTIGKLVGASQGIVFNDARGNLVFEYPWYDALPRMGQFNLYSGASQTYAPDYHSKKVKYIASAVLEGEQADPTFHDIPKKAKDLIGSSPSSAEEASNKRMHYYDHDLRYVIPMDSAVSYAKQVDASRYVTYLEAPFGFHYADDFGDVGNLITTGYSWGTPAEIMRFGYSEKTLTKIYADVGPETSTANTAGLLTRIAKSFRLRYNLELNTASVQIGGGYGHQVGRNVIMPFDERSYFLTGIQHQIQVGKGHSCTLQGILGKPLWLVVGNPWLMWADIGDDIIDPSRGWDNDGKGYYNSFQYFEGPGGIVYALNPRAKQLLEDLEERFDSWWWSSEYRAEAEQFLSDDETLDHVRFICNGGRHESARMNPYREGRCFFVTHIAAFTDKDREIPNTRTALLSEHNPLVKKALDNDEPPPRGYVFANELYAIAQEAGCKVISCGRSGQASEILDMDDALPPTSSLEESTGWTPDIGADNKYVGWNASSACVIDDFFSDSVYIEVGPILGAEVPETDYIKSATTEEFEVLQYNNIYTPGDRGIEAIIQFMMSTLENDAFSHITLHCSGSSMPCDKERNYAVEFSNDHKEKGWCYLSYHFVVNPNGDIVKGEAGRLGLCSYHTGGWNGNNIGLNFVGSFADASLTEEQSNTYRQLVKALNRAETRLGKTWARHMHCEYNGDLNRNDNRYNDPGEKFPIRYWLDREWSDHTYIETDSSSDFYYHNRCDILRNTPNRSCKCGSVMGD